MSWIFFPGVFIIVLFFYLRPPSLPHAEDVAKSYRLSDLTNITTVDNTIYEKFASDWWQKDSGAFTGLHSITPVRVDYFMKSIKEWRRNRKDTRIRGSSENADGDARNLVIADVGCGAGILTTYLAKKLAKQYGEDRIQVFGIDPAQSAIEEAKRKIAEDERLNNIINFEVGSGEKLNMRTSSVDILVMSDVLEHIADLRSVMKEVSRVLKPGGLFLFDTMNRTTRSFVLFIRLAQQNLVPSLAVCPPNTHDYRLFITPEEMDQLFRENGMQRQGQYEGILLKRYNIRTILTNLYRLITKQISFPEGGILPLVGKFELVDGETYDDHYAGAAVMGK